MALLIAMPSQPFWEGVFFAENAHMMGLPSKSPGMENFVPVGPGHTFP